MVKKTLIILTSFFVAVLFTSSGFAADLTTPQLAKEKVTAACKLLEAEGEGAFAKIKDPEGEFRFASDGYIWIQDLNAVVLMHPIKPSLDGKDMSGFADKNGTLLFLNFSEICADEGAGWVPYVWPKPGQENTSPKISYVKHVVHGGKDYVAGCGVYDITPDDIKKMFPGDAIFEE